MKKLKKAYCHFRLSPEEMEILYKKASKKKFSISQYIREILFNLKKKGAINEL